MGTCSVEICDRPSKTQGLCHAHYMRRWYTGRLDPDRPIGVRAPRASLPDRFWRMVDKEPGGCWPWRGAVSPTGYCYTKVDGQTRLAHRVSFELANGPIPDGFQIDHLCHNKDKSCAGGWTCRHRRCVNPRHLGIATQSENLRRGRCGQAVRKRVAAITHCPKGHDYATVGFYIQKGSGTRRCKECHRARMAARTVKAQGLPDPRRTDEAMVQRVRELLAAGRTHAQINAETGVSMATVSRIRNGGSWFTPA